jgi:hypothetical protein
MVSFSVRTAPADAAAGDGAGEVRAGVLAGFLGLTEGKADSREGYFRERAAAPHVPRLL